MLFDNAKVQFFPLSKFSLNLPRKEELNLEKEHI